MRPSGLKGLSGALRHACAALPGRIRAIAPQALLVTCIVTILDFQTTWLHAAEVALYAQISNLGSGRPALVADDPWVVVAEDIVTTPADQHPSSVDRARNLETMYQEVRAEVALLLATREHGP